MDHYKNPLWDSSLDWEKRLDWLLEALSLDEKLHMLATVCPQISRLGIRSTWLGGEAGHGVEAKHDRSVNWGAPRATTVFPQPIGMSQTWDASLIKEIGEAVGTEARILYEQEGRHGGLCCWGPMAEPGQDPRWGRTEECYGEDPCLISGLASSYIRGLRGEHERYLRTAPTVKGFYGCHTQQRPAGVSVDPRNQYEYYLEPYRRCLEHDGAQAVMAADQWINGVPGLLNPQLQEVIRSEWQAKVYVVGAEGALEKLCGQEGYEDKAAVLAQAVDAGVDCFADRPEYVSEAAREAYDRGLLRIEQLNRAIRNTFRARLRLGMFDGDEDNPYASIDQTLLAGPLHGALSLRAGREGIVLLKNQGEMLPLYKESCGKIAVLGPLANEWMKDWNGGIPPYHKTPYEGIREVFSASQVTYTDGKRRVHLISNGRYVKLLPDGQLALSEAKEAEEFVVSDWDQGEVNFLAASVDCYLTVLDDGRVSATRREVFGHPVRECFYIIRESEGVYGFCSWCGQSLYWDQDGKLRAAMEGREAAGALFTLEVVWDGMLRAQTLASEADCAVVVLGTNPVIGGHMGKDRKQYRLPRTQVSLLQHVWQANPNVILVVVSNYPHDLSNCMELARAVLFSASGCQELGRAIADVIAGDFNPSGRLSMTWYPDFAALPSKESCNIIADRQTYQYYTGPVQFPFGYGLSYTRFDYQVFALEKRKDSFAAVVCVRNTGSRDGAEVVQLYAAREDPAITRPKRKLVGFAYIWLRAGEAGEVTITVPFRELMVYDVITESMVLAEGVYRFWLGKDADTPVRCFFGREPAEAAVYLAGDIRMRRDFASITSAWLYDECQNICLSRRGGYQSADVMDSGRLAKLIYRMGDNTGLASQLLVSLWAEPGSTLTVTINDSSSGEYPLDTGGQLQEMCISLPAEMAMWGYIDELITLQLTLKGNMGISYFWFEGKKL